MSRTFGCQGSRERIGVLIAQLGTPEAPTARALRPYLRQFLGDRRVIEVNRLLWWFILNVFILPFRPAKSAALYRRIWTEQGSPLLCSTRDLSIGLQERMRSYSEDIIVDFGMRYGVPSISSAVDRLIDDHHCNRILLFSMYPQYSGTTTASNYDAFFSHILKRRVVPTVRVVEPYYRDTRFISALARSIDASIATLDWKPEKLYLSYHGIPLAYRDAGDTYCCHCTETTEALRTKLTYPSEQIQQVFQSRFGKDPWLTPYTDETVEAAAKAGLKRMAIACPGFTTDCLETLDEMGNELREVFEEHGGEKFHLIPCLNTEEYWLDAMAAIAADELGCWLSNSAVTGCTITCPIDGRCCAKSC